MRWDLFKKPWKLDSGQLWLVGLIVAGWDHWGSSLWFIVISTTFLHYFHKQPIGKASHSSFSTTMKLVLSENVRSGQSSRFNTFFFSRTKSSVNQGVGILFCFIVLKGINRSPQDLYTIILVLCWEKRKKIQEKESSS